MNTSGGQQEAEVAAQPSGPHLLLPGFEPGVSGVHQPNAEGHGEHSGTGAEQNGSPAPTA